MVFSLRRSWAALRTGRTRNWRPGLAARITAAPNLGRHGAGSEPSPALGALCRVCSYTVVPANATSILALAAQAAPGEVIHPRRHIVGHLSNPVGQRLGDVTGLKIGDGTVQAPRLVIARTLADREYAR